MGARDQRREQVDDAHLLDIEHAQPDTEHDQAAHRAGGIEDAWSRPPPATIATNAIEPRVLGRAPAHTRSRVETVDSRSTCILRNSFWPPLNVGDPHVYL